MKLSLIRRLSSHGRQILRNPREYVRARRLAGQGKPAAISLDTSAVCNLRCRMCSLPQHGPKKMMSWGVFASLLPHLEGVRSVTFSNSGEPLLHPELPRMIETARSLAATDCELGLHTNGTLMDESMARSLVESGLTTMWISLDGSRAGTYEAIREKADFELVVENVARLVRIRGASPRPRLGVQFVAMRSNIEELPGLVSLAAELGCEAVAVNGLEPYFPELVEECLWIDSGANHSRRIFSESSERAQAAGLRLLLPQASPGERRCAPTPIISSEGDLVPCSPLMYKRPVYVSVEGGVPTRREMWREKLSFGNVREQPLPEIWTSRAYSEFRRQLRLGQFPAVCEGCPISYGVICT